MHPAALICTPADFHKRKLKVFHACLHAKLNFISSVAKSAAHLKNTHNAFKYIYLKTIVDTLPCQPLNSQYQNTLPKLKV